jgi:ferritin-like protein
MSQTIESQVIAEGAYGLPLDYRDDPGPRRGTIEWLLDAVERHASAEHDALAEYAFVAEASADPVVALVMQLILEDEERHHGLLRRIEATLRDALYWTHSPSALPPTSLPQPPLSRDLVAIARNLVEEERSGARMMRELAHREKGIDAGLDSLLLEMMAMDSEKHAHLLQFVQQRLEKRSRGSDGPTD